MLTGSPHASPTLSPRRFDSNEEGDATEVNAALDDLGVDSTTHSQSSPHPRVHKRAAQKRHPLPAGHSRRSDIGACLKPTLGRGYLVLGDRAWGVGVTGEGKADIET